MTTVGHRTHPSARYRVGVGWKDEAERHSSSGVMPPAEPFDPRDR